MKNYKEEELTEWFPPTTKPFNIGVYMTALAGVFEAVYQYWDGHDFGLRAKTPNGAVHNGAAGISSRIQDVYFRGLKEKPE